MKTVNSIIECATIVFFIITILHLETLWVKWIVESLTQYDLEYFTLIMCIIATEIIIFPLKIKKYLVLFLIFCTLYTLILL